MQMVCLFYLLADQDLCNAFDINYTQRKNKRNIGRAIVVPSTQLNEVNKNIFKPNANKFIH